MASVLSDHSGDGIEKLSEHPEVHALTVGGKRENGVRPTSLLSKVAMLLKPEIFLPIDDWAEKGLHRLVKRKPSRHGYVGFLKTANDIWTSSSHGDVVRNYLARSEVSDDANRRKPGFDRRMFDSFLMACGGRFGPENNPDAI